MAHWNCIINFSGIRIRLKGRSLIFGMIIFDWVAALNPLFDLLVWWLVVRKKSKHMA